MKKRHKLYQVNFQSFPLCRVHNKTWCYKGTNDWGKVTCQNCLAKKETNNPRTVGRKRRRKR